MYFSVDSRNIYTWQNDALRKKKKGLCDNNIYPSASDECYGLRAGTNQYHRLRTTSAFNNSL